MTKLRNLGSAVAVGGGLFLLLAYLEASTPGLDLGPTKYVLPTVLGGGLFAGLNARAGNRRVPVANDARKAELLDFPPRPDCGWIVVMRDKGVIASGMGLDVSVDGSMVTQLMPKRFTVAALPVGTHRLSLAVPGSPSDFTVEPLDITVTPGAILLFAIRASMGLMRSTLRLDPVPDTSALRASLARMQLVEPEEGSS